MNIDNDELRNDLTRILGPSSSAWCGCCEGDMTGEFERNLAEVIPEIENLFAAQRQALRDEVMGALPDEKVGTEKIPLNEVEHGYNIATQDSRAAISTIFEGKKGQS